MEAFKSITCGACPRDSSHTTAQLWHTESRLVAFLAQKPKNCAGQTLAAQSAPVEKTPGRGSDSI